MAVVCEELSEPIVRLHTIETESGPVELCIRDGVYGAFAEDSTRLLHLTRQATTGDPKGAAAEYICDSLESWSLTRGGSPIPLEVETLKGMSMHLLATVALWIYERQENIQLFRGKSDAEGLILRLLKARAQELLDSTAHLPATDKSKQVAREAARRAGLIGGITVKELTALVRALNE